MNAFNDKIYLNIWNDKNDFFVFKAFKGLPEHEAVERLKKLYYKKYTKRYRFAKIIVNGKEIFKAIDGIDVTGKAPKIYYGAEISKFKMKILLQKENGEQEKLPPVYSNIEIEKKSIDDAFWALVNHAKTKYRKNLISALIYDIKADKLVAQFVNRKGRIIQLYNDLIIQ